MLDESIPLPASNLPWVIAICRRCSSTSTTTGSARSAGRKPKKELSDEEKQDKSKRKQIQEKLIKFATRIPAFMYLTDFRENTHQSGHVPHDTVIAIESESQAEFSPRTVGDQARRYTRWGSSTRCAQFHPA